MIKSILLIILFYLFSFSLCAQIDKSQWLVGGNTNFSYSNDKGTTNGVQNNYKKTSFQFSPAIGYFIINQLCAGVKIGISTSHDKQITDGQKTEFPFYFSTNSKTSSVNISPFARYYFLDKTHKINILSDLSYSYNFNKEKFQFSSITTNPDNGQPISSNSATNNKYNSYSLTIAGGPVLFINPNASIELTLGYSFSKYTGLTKTALLIGAGFQIHLGKPK